MRILVITLLFSLNAAAGEVTEFKPRPAAVEQGSDTYVGILLSEEDFRKLLQDKIDTNAKIAECDVDKKVCTQLQEQYKLSVKSLQETIQKDNTWFRRNKGAIGILSGLVIGVGTTIAIVKAVNQ
jgi:chemotaxis methyl-accepting protein methylase